MGNFAKPLQKQWLDFYLDRLREISTQKIDKGAAPNRVLDLIKGVVSELEEQEERDRLNRIVKLESMKQHLKEFGSADLMQPEAP